MVFISSTLVVSTLDCPVSVCKCRPRPGQANDTNIVCNRKGLTEVPSFTRTGEDYYELTLADNDIEMIEDNAFENVNITRLNLLKNKFTSISPGAFWGLETQLKELMFGGNDMVKVPDALNVLMNLTLLHLENFRLNSPGLLPNMPNIEVLRLTDCEIMLLSPGFLDRFNHTLRELYLDKNNIFPFPAQVLNSASQVEILDLSDNHFRLIPEYGFSKMVRLKELRMRHNGIETFEVHAFKSLETSLEVLNLENNKLTDEDLIHIANLRNLKELRLGYNDIVTLPSGIFATMYSLETLDLHHNFIESTLAFRSALPTNLISLYLEENKIAQISNNSFTNLKNLQTLKLDKQSSEVMLLHTDSFKGLETSLNYLYLSESLISIRWSSIAQLSHLVSLSLAGNDITTIPDDSFVNLKQLISLDLSDNKLTTLNQNTLHGLQKSLKNLHLQKNQLTTLTDCVLYDFRIEDLSLNHNPLHCDCQMNWLSDWVAAQDRLVKETLEWTCATPNVYKDQYFRDTNTSVEGDLQACNEPIMCEDLLQPTTTIQPTTSAPETTTPGPSFTLSFDNFTSDSLTVKWHVEGYNTIINFIISYKKNTSVLFEPEVGLSNTHRQYRLVDLDKVTFYVICVKMNYGGIYRAYEEDTCETHSTLGLNPLVGENIDDGNNTGVIVGVIVGVLLVILIIGIVAFCYTRYYRNEKDYPDSRDMPAIAYNSKRYKKSKAPAVTEQNKRTFLMENGTENLTEQERNKIVSMLTADATRPSHPDDNRWSQASTGSNPRYVKDIHAGTSPVHIPPNLPPRPIFMGGYLNPVDLMNENNEHIYAEIEGNGDIKECHI